MHFTLVKKSIFSFLSSYSFWQFCSKQCIEYFMKFSPKMESNYPELLHYVMIINAPRFFNMMFSVIKPFMSQATLDKLQVFGSSSSDRAKWVQIVQQRFPAESMPPHWGGCLEGDDPYCTDSPIWVNCPKQGELKELLEGSRKFIDGI